MMDDIKQLMAEYQDSITVIEAENRCKVTLLRSIANQHQIQENDIIPWDHLLQIMTLSAQREVDLGKKILAMRAPSN